MIKIIKEKIRHRGDGKNGKNIIKELKNIYNYRIKSILESVKGRIIIMASI